MPPSKEDRKSDRPHTASASANNGMRRGTVTFLDVLGWKGIWLRQNASTSVRQLSTLVDTASERTRGTNTTVLSISDTIVLLTEGSPDSIEIHGSVVASLVCDSLRCSLPLRGATSYGEFYYQGTSIMVGPAIDEAATWHESADWIGVIQTPSAFLQETTAPSWELWQAPIKGHNLGKVPCANWPSQWKQEGQTSDDLRETFSTMGPFDGSVATKYTNALAFFGAMTSKRPQLSPYPASTAFARLFKRRGRRT